MIIESINFGGQVTATLKRAAIYMRSSADEHALGEAIQRPELQALAAQKKLVVVGEFSDMAVSGSLDETQRAGLANMLAAAKRHEFDCVLAIDTSRIARDQMLALY